MGQKRAEHYGISVGKLPKGPNNLVTDVPGVTVGHCTLSDGDLQTGVTVLLPCKENMCHHNLPANIFVLNGYGKSAGLIQVTELGNIESPIAFTNTLNVGKVHDAMVDYLCQQGQAADIEVQSINPIVMECNDSVLSDIRRRAVESKHVFAAIEAADVTFAEGAVGAGRGMICHDLKGGIGSASRLMEVEGKTYTMGVLVLANHGSLSDLMIDGKHVGKELAPKIQEAPQDRGSCIVVLVTDLPLSDRQLGRVTHRAPVALARLGAHIGQGSGEIFMAISTANPIDPKEKTPLRSVTAFNEELMDIPFRAAIECTEEALVNILFTAETVTGYKGKTIHGLTDIWTPEGQ